MCVALPARIVQTLGNGRALIEQGEVQREVNILPIGDANVGDYVLLNLGVAVRKMSADEAQEVLDLWKQISLSFSFESESES